jgi:hypothetical protein
MKTLTNSGDFIRSCIGISSELCVSLLFFIIFTTTLAAPQREYGASNPPFKKPTANLPPVILKSNSITRFKNQLWFTEQFTESLAAS